MMINFFIFLALLLPPQNLTVALCPQQYVIIMSGTADRSNPQQLAGQSVAGVIYVFILPEDGIRSVDFLLDEMPVKTENIAPFDFLGTDEATGYAKPFDSASLPSGSHEIQAIIQSVCGDVVIKSAFLK